MDENLRKERLQKTLGPEIQEFCDTQQTLQLATVDSNGAPNISYAPFIRNSEGYFILISQIAKHAQNLDKNPNLSMMIIEDEQHAKEIFARKRITFDGIASIVSRNNILWEQVIKQMKQRFGDKVIDHISNFRDFNLYKIIVSRGLFVKGFGQAYQVSDSNEVDILHLVQGHQTILNDK